MDERSETNPTTTENPPESQGASPDEVASLRSQMEAQAKRLDEVTRAYADLLNEREAFRRRVERDRDQQIENARADVAAALLDSLDDLRRALAAEENASGLYEGVRLIAENMTRRLEAMGLTQIPTVGHYFDPNLHEAVDLALVQESDQDGRVVEEVRAGWRVGERVVRAARVRVGRYQAPPEGGN